MRDVLSERSAHCHSGFSTPYVMQAPLIAPRSNVLCWMTGCCSRIEEICRKMSGNFGASRTFEGSIPCRFTLKSENGCSGSIRLLTTCILPSPRTQAKPIWQMLEELEFAVSTSSATKRNGPLGMVKGFAEPRIGLGVLRTEGAWTCPALVPLQVLI